MPKPSFVEVRVQSLGLDQTTKTPVVILQEVEGSRILPIWIGPNEASAIAMELTGMKFSRPLTHDLAANLVRGLGGVLQRVTIARVENNTYYAEMVIQRGDEVIAIDARPSDSIAIALRLRARLYANEELLTEGAVDMVEPEPAVDLEQLSEQEPSVTPEELEARLRRLRPEDLGRFQP